jgi:hypothetical protein
MEDNEKEDVDMQHDIKQAHNASSDSMKVESTFTSDSASTSEISQSKIMEEGRDENTSYHIPVHTFSTMLAELLLDQNSNLASLAQQCIVSVAFQLANISNGETSPNDDVEIFDGIILGLLSVVDRAKTSSTGNSSQDESQSGVGSPDSQNAGSAQKAVFQMNDDVDQGEINLAKMVSLSVCSIDNWRSLTDVSSTADFIYYQLIASLASILGEERCIKQCLPIVEEMAKDNVFYVRKEAASAIGSLAAVVNRNVVVDRLVSIWFSVSLHILVIISNL